MEDLAIENKVLESCQPDGDFSEFEISLTVQQTAELTGLSEHNLRYYERVGLISPVYRETNSRHRRYTKDDVARIQTLVCLRMVGMPIEEMRHYFEIAKDGVSAAAELQGILVKQRAVLKERLREMKKSMDYIEHKIEFWKAVENGDDARAEEIKRTIFRQGK